MAVTKLPNAGAIARLFLLSTAALILAGAIATPHFAIEEATVEQIQQAFAQNQLTSKQLVNFYFDQIRSLNPLLRGVLEVNPDALRQAEQADRERAAGGLLTDLHGIPVLLKDGIGTRDALNTTCGSYALLGSVVARDAGVVERLRRAGAVILGKASQSEWYNVRSFSIPGGWCARSGQAVNPYVEGGNPCGSSSGSAVSVAANMVAVSLGTETDGSILCPADRNSVVGIKPTVGLEVFRRGGATVVDHLEIAEINVILDPFKSGEVPVLMAEFKVGINQYLEELVESPVRSLADIIAFNINNPVLENMKEYAQDLLVAAETTNGIGEQEVEAMQLMENLSREGFEGLMKQHKLDAMVTFGADAAPVLAMGGYPAISVPAGYDGKGSPFGIAFGGLKGTEPKLIEVAYAFEQATNIRRPPSKLQCEI
ncbi:unnamed protein product [Linum tenue]|uniref:Amidase domain-containing protein n=1 Tax=Linum tenue TaxID=586396 RepID=A0AAV0RJ24_9ROSI|nr:unnamed protein product [Linum tenue]